MHTGEGLHRFVDPVDDEVYLYSQFEVADARRVFACFDQPDLKARSPSPCTAPAHWQVVSISADARAGRRCRTDGAAAWRFAPTPPLSHLRHRGRRRAVPPGRRRADQPRRPDDPARRVLPAVAGRAPGRRRRSSTSPGPASPASRSCSTCAYPFAKYDQLFVPGVQRRGDGERRRASPSPRLRLPLQGARGHRRAARADRAARAGPHVVRRPGHHALVGRPVAERVLRRVRQHPLPAPRRPAGRGAWTTFPVAEKSWAYRQDQLASTHPIVADIRDLEDVEVNFDGITYAKGASVLKQLVHWVGAGGLRRRACGATSAAHAWGNTTLADLLAELEATSGRDLDAWSRQWLQHRRGDHPAPGARRRRATASITGVAIAPGGAARATRCCGRTGSASAATTSSTDGELLTRTARVELDVAGARTDVPRAGRPARAGPAAGQRRRPRLRQDPAGRAARWPPRWTHLGALRRLAAADPGLGRRLGHDPRRRAAGPAVRRPGAAQPAPR